MRRLRVPGRRVAVSACVVLAAALLQACGGSADESSKTGAQAASSCTPKHPGLKTVEKGYLTVAAIQLPPYATIKDGALGGAEGEIVNRIAREECLKVKPLEGVAASVVPAITSGRADTGIGSWYRTAERAKIVLLGQPEMKEQMAIVSKQDNPIKSVAELKGHKVGAVTGYLWVEDLQKLLGGDLKLYPTADAEYRDLAAGRTEAVIDGTISWEGQIKKTPVPGAAAEPAPPDPAVKATTQPGQPQLAVNKDNPGLRTALDDVLSSLRASGELEKIFTANGVPASAADTGPPNLL